MHFDINSGYIVSAAVGLALLGWNLLLRGKFKSITILFQKVDAGEKALADYKLHVAENYINEKRLREQLAPLKKSIDDMKDDLNAIRTKMMNGDR